MMQPTFGTRRTLANGDGVNAGWDSRNTLSKDTDPLRMAESSSGGEGRAPKRVQREVSNEMIPARPAEPTPSAGMRPDPFPTPAARRRQSSFRDQTFRDQRALPNSTSLQSSPSKRLAYNGLSKQNSPQRSFAPHASQDSHSRQTSTSSARFSVASGAPIGKRETSQSSFDFLPPVNFDDCHASIGSVEPDIDSFPKPGGSSYGLGRTTNGSVTIPHRPGLNGPSKTVDSAELGSRIGLNGSSLRRHNSTSQQRGQIMAAPESAPVLNGSASARARRKTYFATPATGPGVMRAPRKSVGPGVLTMHIPGQGSAHKRPSLAQAGLGESTDTPNSPASRNVSETQPRSFELSRHSKTKSLQPPPRRIFVQEEFFTPTSTPDPTLNSPIGSARSPGVAAFPAPNTPLSNKRMSMMPGSAHATGLGARTISPTDARRMKRMSMMPNPPSMPFTPPTPSQLDPPPSSGRQTAPSPSLVPRKSVTPSSSRTTPDLNRKSYSSGISNSSTTSYSSFLASTGSSRISQSLSASRLPTLKNRSDNPSIGDDEIVPPVPAIPKAYESPKAEFEQQPFFNARKFSLGHDASSLNSASNSVDLPSPIDLEPPKHDKVNRPNRAYNVEIDSSTERKASGGPNANRRTLQALRLPPLNLLPLSTPTSTRIAALYDGSTSDNTGSITPPPKIGQKTTPTTPMTASKASFATNYYDDHNTQMPAQIRSSSSHYNMRPEALSYRADSSTSTAAPTPSDSYAMSASRTAMSPFISSSLPKTSGEFGYGLQKFNTFDTAAEARPTKLTGPRLQKPRKASKDDAANVDTTTPVDGPASSIGNSIRRKLSLTRKRSNSKAQTAAERDAEPPPKPPKHDNMPPPRLPASATWSGPVLASPTPSQQSNSYRARNPSTSSNQMQLDRTRSSTWDTAETPKKESGISGSKKTARANIEATPGLNALSLKDFLKEAKNMEPPLDRDDLAAEEEMKKLAAKRKETENAAKEVDALRRRANAKERVSPSAALKMANLNIFERGEIVDYKDIYFCGTKDAKKHVGDLTAEAANFGYDDERGDYNIVTGDHLAYRYEIVDILGKGSFGQVVRCIDHRTGGLVAIKIIRNKKRFHQQALVEVDILQKLREWDPHNKHSVVNFTQSLYFRGHLCISTELLGMNLYEFIKCHDFRGFSLKLIRRFAKQLLGSLVLLKAHKVIHCDLKPENVLLAHPARSEIKVIDFGSSCLENEKVYTYIQSRFYRSPEVILGMTYGMPIDMWSLGCILAELLTGYPIFPGENEQEQLACIMEVFGPPEKHLIEKSTRKKLFFDSLGKPRIMVSTKGKRRRPSSKSLQQVLKCEDEAFLDFITRCLRWDPDRRLKADEAIHHEFISGKAAKPVTRPRTAPSNSSSPIKRFNSISQTPSVTRPLPEPPATSFKNGTAIRAREVSTNSQSPSKAASTPAAPKRHSTLTGPSTNGNPAGTKRYVNGVLVQSSALPRAMGTPKVTGKEHSHLAAAAAAASLKSR